MGMGTGNIHMDMGECSFLGKDDLHGSMDMSVNLSCLTGHTFPTPKSNVPLHARPHKEVPSKFLSTMNSGVLHPKERIKYHMVQGGG